MSLVSLKLHHRTALCPLKTPRLQCEGPEKTSRYRSPDSLGLPACLRSYIRSLLRNSAKAGPMYTAHQNGPYPSLYQKSPMTCGNIPSKWSNCFSLEAKPPDTGHVPDEVDGASKMQGIHVCTFPPKEPQFSENGASYQISNSLRELCTWLNKVWDTRCTQCSYTTH